MQYLEEGFLSCSSARQVLQNKIVEIRSMYKCHGCNNAVEAVDHYFTVMML